MFVTLKTICSYFTWTSCCLASSSSEHHVLTIIIIRAVLPAKFSAAFFPLTLVTRPTRIIKSFCLNRFCCATGLSRHVFPVQPLPILDILGTELKPQQYYYTSILLHFYTCLALLHLPLLVLDHHIPHNSDTEIGLLVHTPHTDLFFFFYVPLCFNDKKYLAGERGIPEEVRFPVHRDDPVLDIDLSKTKNILPFIFCQISGERQTVIRALLNVLENIESHVSMSKTVCLIVITPLLVDIPGEVGEACSGEDRETVSNFDQDEHVLRARRHPKGRRGDGYDDGGEEEDDTEASAHDLNKFRFGEGWQETHGETGSQIYHCQRDENLQIDVKDLAVGQDVIAVGEDWTEAYQEADQSSVEGEDGKI